MIAWEEAKTCQRRGGNGWCKTTSERIGSKHDIWLQFMFKMVVNILLKKTSAENRINILNKIIALLNNL